MLRLTEFDNKIYADKINILFCSGEAKFPKYALVYADKITFCSVLMRQKQLRQLKWGLQNGLQVPGLVFFHF